MKPRSFSDLYREAERHQDYWVAGVILEFTECVVQEMARQRLTRTALAERLGATPAYVTKILRGRVNFTLATMVRLSHALGIDLHAKLGTSPFHQTAQATNDAPAGRSTKVVATTSKGHSGPGTGQSAKQRLPPAARPRTR
jgi:ribosome-binding protein aMBF1 (putative translation factor)